jgi:hypothetical protein
MAWAFPRWKRSLASCRGSGAGQAGAASAAATVAEDEESEELVVDEQPAGRRGARRPRARSRPQE